MKQIWSALLLIWDSLSPVRIELNLDLKINSLKLLSRKERFQDFIYDSQILFVGTSRDTMELNVFMQLLSVVSTPAYTDLSIMFRNFFEPLDNLVEVTEILKVEVSNKCGCVPTPVILRVIIGKVTMVISEPPPTYSLLL
jgi:hypothetical protein